ncbi:ABC transporter ATP-binding protein [candidate division KSB1 bacterium]|nr:ABC transporter ATP-binding protein [candidate division KSB1 bacterium]
MDINKLPDPIQKIFSEQFQEEPLRIAVAADLNRQVKFGEEWLIATNNRLVLFSLENSTAAILAEFQLQELKKIATVNLMGSGFVEIEVNGTAQRLINYTNAKNADFARAVEVLSALIEQKEIPVEREEHKKRICESCGFPIPKDLNKCPRCTEKWKTLRKILAFARPYRWHLFFMFLLLVAGTGFGLISPYISKLLIDIILLPDPATGVFHFAHWLPLAALALLVSYAGQNILSSFQMRLSGIVGHRTVADLRAAIYYKLQEQALAFFDKYHTGGLMARVNQDTYELHVLLVHFIPATIESVLTLIGIGIFLFMLNWKLTLVVLIPIIATAIFWKKIISRIIIFYRRYYHRRSRLSAQVNDSLSGMRVIKAFGQEDEELHKFDRKNILLQEAGVEREVKLSLYFPTLDFLIMSGTILVWFIGGKYVISGEMTLGDVVAYTGYLMMFYRPVYFLTRFIQVITSSISAAERIFDVIDTKPQIMDSPTAQAMPELQGAIEFKDVSFGYDLYKPVIKDFNVSIHANEIIGLVGKSGAGKSTFINLVCRLYDVNRGAILVDGKDVRDIKYHDLRSQIGVVLQETFLFDGTIYDNIAYARPEATIEEVIAAAKAANAHEFILKKNDGYDTEVGERGNRLSGGEKQRISIARAILRNPRILILDEATSSLDTETEKKIQEAMQNLTRGRTTIAIAHRLSTLRNCHRLLVIDEGKLVEVGTHEELMAKKGIFHDLVSLQTEMSKIIALSG